MKINAKFTTFNLFQVIWWTVVILRCFDVITWSWWVIMSPLYGLVIIIFTMLIFDEFVRGYNRRK